MVRELLKSEEINLQVKTQKTRKEMHGRLTRKSKYTDLFFFFLLQVVHKLGGFNRVMNQNQWKVVSNKMQLQSLGSQGPNLIKAAYKR